MAQLPVSVIMTRRSAFLLQVQAELADTPSHLQLCLRLQHAQVAGPLEQGLSCWRHSSGRHSHIPVLHAGPGQLTGPTLQHLQPSLDYTCLRQNLSGILGDEDT